MFFMDNLPLPLQLEILNRLSDSTDLARCRVASKTLDTLAHDVRSLNILCSYDRYLKSRAPETEYQITPFKLLVKKLLMSFKNVEKISIGLEREWREISIDDRYLDDLYFMDVDYVSEWLPEIAGRLNSISITNFDIQATRKRSEILSLISSYCNLHLVELELKNVCLLMEGLKPMPVLKTLKLEAVMLEGEDLNMVNECFPFLQTLNLIGVRWRMETPNIHLLHLKTCECYIHDDHLSLTIQTPKLMDLKLKCRRINTLILKAPLLSALHLSVQEASDVFEVEEEFINLKSLHLKSPDLYNLIKLFPVCNKVEKLVLNSSNWVSCSSSNIMEDISFEQLMSTFPNVTDLSLRPGAWVKLEKCFLVGGLKAGNGWRRLKLLVARVVVYDVETTRHFISSILERFTTLSEMGILVHRRVASDVRSRLISSCMGGRLRIRWKWGMWSQGQKDTWVSDGV